MHCYGITIFVTESRFRMSVSHLYNKSQGQLTIGICLHKCSYACVIITINIDDTFEVVAKFFCEKLPPEGLPLRGQAVS